MRSMVKRTAISSGMHKTSMTYLQVIVLQPATIS